MVLGAAQIHAGVFDALVENALQHRFERRTDFADVAEGQRTFVQLAVLHFAAHQLADQRGDLLLRRVGQRADGAVIFVVLQGRQPAVLGVSRQQLAEIMVEYGAVNAGNLDGGASSDMYFNGKYVNVCNTSGGPRGIPTAVVVMPAQ